MSSVRLTELTAKHIREGGYDTAILPVGATEYHGDHLPYCTDTLTAEALAVRFAEELRTALVLPPLAVGVSPHLLAWPWTLSLRPTTLVSVVIDIAESLLQHEIRRLLIVSAHDGNPGALDAAARELWQSHGMTVAIFFGWQSMSRRLLAGTEFEIDLDHGGQSEMSMTLLLAPELAHPEWAVDRPEERGDHPVRVVGGFDGVVPHGHSGAASRGTAAEGAAIVDAIAAHVAPFLRDLAAHDWRNGAWMSGIEP